MSALANMVAMGRVTLIGCGISDLWEEYLFNATTFRLEFLTINT